MQFRRGRFMSSGMDEVPRRRRSIGRTQHGNERVTVSGRSDPRSIGVSFQHFEASSMGATKRLCCSLSETSTQAFQQDDTADNGKFLSSRAIFEEFFVVTPRPNALIQAAFFECCVQIVSPHTCRKREERWSYQSRSDVATGRHGAPRGRGPGKQDRRSRSSIVLRLSGRSRRPGSLRFPTSSPKSASR